MYRFYLDAVQALGVRDWWLRSILGTDTSSNKCDMEFKIMFASTSWAHMHQKMSRSNMDPTIPPNHGSNMGLKFDGERRGMENFVTPALRGFVRKHLGDMDVAHAKRQGASQDKIVNVGLFLNECLLLVLTQLSVPCWVGVQCLLSQ